MTLLKKETESDSNTTFREKLRKPESVSCIRQITNNTEKCE